MQRIVPTMIKTCEILVTTWNGQVLAGKIVLENGKLKSITSQKKYKDLVQYVRNTNTFSGKKELSPKENPKEWLKSLPAQYSGSHLRARLVEQENKRENSPSKQTALNKPSGISDGIVPLVGSTISLSEVQKFVKHGLQEKLQRDLRSLRILKEGDVECCAYYHLRRLLTPDPNWRIFARKYSPKTGFYTDLIIFRAKKARVAIEIKWGRKRISKKDRRALASARKNLRVRKTYFYCVSPDASTYRKLPEKRKTEKFGLFEVVVDLGYASSRGRDGDCSPPPARTRTGAINASGSYRREDVDRQRIS